MRYNIKLLSYFVIFTVVISSCNRNSNQVSDKELICGAENVIDTLGQKLFLMNDDNGFVSGGDGQSEEEAHSGKYSLKLSGNLKYGFTYIMDNHQKDEFIVVSVWRKSTKNNGTIVITTDDPKVYYMARSVPVKKDKEKEGWEMLKTEVLVMPELLDKKLKFYVWNQSDENVYFDDFSVKRKKSFKYPDFEGIDKFSLWLDSTNYKKISDKRLDALQSIILESNSGDWAKATVDVEGVKLKCKIRLKGDWLDHLTGKKWSFRIDLKGKNRWQNMEVFSLQNPKSRNFLSEWVYHKLLWQEDVLTTDYGFIPLFLNGESLGIYAYEEHFSEHLHERYERQKGLIIKFNESGFWEKNRICSEKKVQVKTHVYESALIEPFKKSRILKDPNMLDQFIKAQNLLYLFQFERLPVSEIFDVKKLAQYYALTVLSKGYHGLVWHNFRFFYNPEIGKLEPVAYDAYTEHGVADWVKHPILGNEEEDTVYFGVRSNYLRYSPFNDSLFVSEYIHYLEKYSKASFIDAFMKTINTNLDLYEKYLQMEFKKYQYDLGFLKNNAKAIRSKLPAYKEKQKKIRTAYIYKAKPESFSLKGKNVYTFPLTNSSLRCYSDVNHIDYKVLSMYNFHLAPIEIIGLGMKKDSIIHELNEPIILQGFEGEIPENYKKITVPDSRLRYVYFKNFYHNDSTIYQVEIIPWPCPKIEPPISSK